MTKYIYDREHNCMVDKETGLPMLTPEERARPPQMPRVVSDEEGYRSPIDGSWIEGRRARRYDLEKNNAIDARDLSKPKKLKNERFAKKRGLNDLLEQ